MLGTRERELDVLQSLPLAGAVVELSEGGGLTTVGEEPG